jgi:flagella basal body P-ring formation protein FlgA
MAQASQVALSQILRPVEPVSAHQSTAVAAQPQVKPMKLRLEDLLDRLEHHLAADIAADDSVELSSRAHWLPVIIDSTADWDVYTDNSFSPDTRGNWFPLVHLEVNGETAGSWRLPLRVALYRRVHMAYERLGRGDTPKAPAVRPVVKDIYRERGNPIAADVDLSGYELVQPVGEGRLLSWNDVMQRPSVRRGDMVEVVINDGALAVSMTAMSLQDGVPGELITLRNTRSRQEFAARVTGLNKVELSTGERR